MSSHTPSTHIGSFDLCDRARREYCVIEGTRATAFCRKVVESTSSFLGNLRNQPRKKNLTEAYGDKTLSGTHVFEWNKTFSGERVSVEDDETTGCPSSAITDQNLAKIRDMSGFPLTYQ
ncbi:hypothetical protein TNCV_3951391 [Trichonephila clavipes]|nr:hypothetical protein TNCV_3951391 [Trichonephila clavipes]